MSDSLILKIVEYDSETLLIANKIYVLYDKYNYILRGEKTKQPTGIVISYSFSCSDYKSLADFICLMMKDCNELHYSLYVHPDLPIQSDRITYDTLTDTLTDCYEITDSKSGQRSEPGLLSALLMVKNVFNSY